jgi:hypothetical protein
MDIHFRGLCGVNQSALALTISIISFQSIRGLSVAPDLQVMMATAYGDDERRRQATEYDAAEFLPTVNFERLKTQ